MQIHDLNTKALTDPAYVAFDDGTDTYKTEFNDVVADAAAAAVADADLTDNTVAFTSGDAASPTAWTAVDVLTSGLSLKTLFNRISTMVKNVRYIWNLLGSSSFSNVASTLTGAIGNTALTTTAQTLSGAIAEHESDISTLNSNFKRIIKTYSKLTITDSNPYAQLDTYAGMGISSNKYLVAMNIRGWSGVSCGGLSLVKSSDGTTFYVMGSKAGSIASVTVEYFFADIVGSFS